MMQSHCVCANLLLPPLPAPAPAPVLTPVSNTVARVCVAPVCSVRSGAASDAHLDAQR